MGHVHACRALLLSVFLCGWVNTALAQAVTVDLRVSAEETVKAALEKCLKDRLQAEGGFVVAAGVPDFTLSVIALKVLTRASTDVGVTLSILVTAPPSPQIREFAELHVAPERRAELLALTSGMVQPLSHWVETAGAGDLLPVCRSIVGSFVKETVSKIRKNGEQRRLGPS